MGKGVILRRIENDRELTEKSDGAFFTAIQRALILALREQGILTQTECFRAQRKLEGKGNP